MIVHIYSSDSTALEKALAGLMNQLPCNSLYCVPGRLIQLIWFYNIIDQEQKAGNDASMGSLTSDNLEQTST